MKLGVFFAVVGTFIAGISAGEIVIGYLSGEAGLLLGAIFRLFFFGAFGAYGFIRIYRNRRRKEDETA